jgi:hypothetical protein
MKKYSETLMRFIAWMCGLAMGLLYMVMVTGGIW